MWWVQEWFKPRDTFIKPMLHFYIPIKERWDAAVRRGHGSSAERFSLDTRYDLDDDSFRIPNYPFHPLR